MTERAILAAVARADMALCGALPWAAAALLLALAMIWEVFRR